MMCLVACIGDCDHRNTDYGSPNPVNACTLNDIGAVKYSWFF